MSLEQITSLMVSNNKSKIDSLKTALTELIEKL